METEGLKCDFCGNELTDAEQLHVSHLCSDCLSEAQAEVRRNLTRNERLQLAADAGFDTWDDYNGER